MHQKHKHQKGNLMDELLTKLLESKLLTDETVASIREALESKEAEIEEKVRAEFTETYRRDKSNLIEAIETMLEDRLRNEMAELHEDRKNFRKMTAKATRAIAEADVRAKKDMEKKYSMLEAAIKEQLRPEIQEFREDVTARRTAFLAELNEQKDKAAKAHENFIKRGATLIESITKDQLKKFISDFRVEIKEANQNDFGRRVFESMAAEFRTTFFNENVEAKKLAERLEESERKIARMNRAFTRKLEEATKIAKNAEKSKALIVEQAERKAKIATLLSRISEPTVRKSMKTILEGTSTDRLEKTFKNYLVEMTSPRGKARGATLLETKASKRGEVRFSNGNNPTELFEGSTPKKEEEADLQREIDALRTRAGLA